MSGNSILNLNQSIWKVSNYTINQPENHSVEVSLVDGTMIFSRDSISIQIIWDKNFLFYSGNYSVFEKTKLVINSLCGSNDTFLSGTQHVRTIFFKTPEIIELTRVFPDGTTHVVSWKFLIRF